MEGTLPAAASEIASAITALLRAFPTADGLPLAQVGTGFSAPTIPYAPTAEPRTLPQRISDLVDANPDAPALADATTQLTRRDLLAHILDIARLLIDAQLTTGRRVAIRASPHGVSAREPCGLRLDGCGGCAAGRLGTQCA